MGVCVITGNVTFCAVCNMCVQVTGAGTLPASVPFVMPATPVRRMALAMQRCSEFLRMRILTVAAMGENMHVPLVTGQNGLLPQWIKENKYQLLLVDLHDTIVR